MSRKQSYVLGLLSLAAAGLIACGGPAHPSQEGVTLRGTLQGSGGPAGYGGDEPILVMVQENPAISDAVAPDGSFTLRGLPDGAIGTQVVLAHEIKIQGDGDGDDDRNTCMISGGRVGKKIELEGTVASGSAPSFEMRVNGNRVRELVDVDAGSASFECVGSNEVPPAQCPEAVVTGAKVHVSGPLASCDGRAALVLADEVKVQK